MKVSKEIAKKEILKLVDLYESYEKLLDSIGSIFSFCPESPFFDLYGKMIDNQIRLIAKIIGDEYDYLNWFFFENDLGKKSFEVTFEGKSIQVKDVDSLLEVIYDQE